MDGRRRKIPTYLFRNAWAAYRPDSAFEAAASGRTCAAELSSGGLPPPTSSHLPDSTKLCMHADRRSGQGALWHSASRLPAANMLVKYVLETYIYCMRIVARMK